MTSLCDLGAIELRRMIGAREISPVELVRASRERIEALNPTLNAVTATCNERAEAEAQAAERAIARGEALGPLHGLPVGIKDTQITEGLRTTFGSPLYADNVPAADERMVAAIRRAGAIVVGKTNVPEFGAGANTTNPVYGPTGNPFEPSRICGGSSGGSAVALATGMVPLATGSDTGGSLRTPAALCGVVGFRTSPGLVPVATRPLGWSALSVHGPMGRDVAEAALMLSVIADADPRDPLAAAIDAARFGSPPPCDLASLRVAFSADLGFAPVDPVVRRAFGAATAALRGCFAETRDANPPLEDADWIFEVLRGAQFLAAHGERYRTRREALGPSIVENVEQALGYSFEDATRAQVAQTELYRRFVAFMGEVDLLVTPAVCVPPFELGLRYPAAIDGTPARTYFHWLALAYGITLTAHPAIAIPCGLDETGTPFGLQLVARRGHDLELLAMARALEQHLQALPGLARPRPDIAALASAR